VPPIAAVREGATLPNGRFASYRTAISSRSSALALALLGYGLFATASPRAAAPVAGVGVLACSSAWRWRRSRAHGRWPRCSAAVRPARRLRGLARRERDAEPAAHAATAAALMIGLALVTMVATLARAGRLRPRLAAPPGAGGLRGHLEERLGSLLPRGGRRGRAAPGVTVASSVRNEQAKVDG
jgi:putative ABC transport system permease protein